MGSQTRIPLGEYIFRRLYDQGIKHIFGVPGDFNLNLIDHLDNVKGMTWIGTCNELNGAYAADGYARTRGLPGVVITTYGVGELSAINGVSGALAEGVPIIHIVGMTARSVQSNRLMIHHTLGEGSDHRIFQDVSKPISAATEFLWEDASFTSQVDRLIEASFQTKLPVYLYVPIDTPDILVDASPLNQPLKLQPEYAEDTTKEIVDAIAQQLGKAERPCFLVDLWTERYGLHKQTQELMDLLELPGFVTPLGKSMLDETNPLFGGTYIGVGTMIKDVKDALESSDLVIHMGRFPSDSNTGGFTQKLAEKGTLVGLNPKYVFVGDKKWDGFSFAPVVPELLKQLKAQKPTIKSPKWWTRESWASQTMQPPKDLKGPIRQSHFWECFQPYLRENDCVIAEVGTSQFGTCDWTLPKGSQYYTQIYYSSIGFTVGATLGSLVARREMGIKGRCLLFVGDGSLQMTVQEISTMIRYGFAPTIFVINNNGYTVERVIHGPAREYNDIARWNYQLMLQFFGGDDKAKSCRAETFEELQKRLADDQFARGENIQVLECMLDKYDSPKLLSDLVDMGQKRGKAALKADDEKNNRERRVLDGNLTDSGLAAGL